MNKSIVYGLIGFGYFLIGIFTWKYQFFIVKLDDTNAMLMGILFIVYGAFRVYRGIKSYKNDQKN
ncbi:C4-dicarboxylate ABC transporter [Empedobacter stercoris]|uniref:C4-dicarboxylate ABC transporter n=2 Tax=Empedobacter TaxID=59734 RepID=A0ABY8V6R9_9FLAO|nr:MULTISPECIES: C4-dicarboxylate ABC transporter [Empedobacter]MCA4776841.1 C4-dicarboxylate ABC transporter [Empedobacter stercoris]MCA4781772.1 C4-dicarboxylate ABC transporter [Empedobacter stercoris]MCA4808335.1 C4-dicarboxylate ABC transporter [Empedobacter stercoris]MDM1523120.1 C4-dicarboxylate ABC transporter [Empedobacter sp. 225-1]MDM1542586.1 C4-dicarboxylate ABC transporter [Empedobacter sp. 189-2]